MQSYKVNSQITYPQVRLIGEDGKQIGIMNSTEACDYALGQGLDLVLISEAAQPPIAKAIDYKKFLYQEQKKNRDAKKNQKAGGIKEVRIGSPFAAEGDLQTRIKQSSKFFADGYTVKFVIKFAGRQITRPEYGIKIIDRFKSEFKNIARVERDAHFEGKQLIAVFVPVKQNAKV